MKENLGPARSDAIEVVLNLRKELKAIGVDMKNI
jgi:hypothetical protein